MRVIPGNAGAMDGNVFIAGRRPQDAVIRVEAGALRMDVPVQVTTRVARAEILPKQPTLSAHETLSLHARAFDAHGYPIALPARLPWRANGGSIDATGAFQAGANDAVVRVRLGERVANQRVTVGEHAAEIPLQSKAAFATAPANGPGGLTKDTPCNACLSLQYDFSGNERAAYANAPIVLPQRALGISADVYGDGNGEVLRLAVNNAINERFLYTLAKIDWHGWRHVELRFPPELPQPITFKSMYVINRVGPGPAVETSGSIALRNVRVLLAGSASNRPK
jgi:hypothetical protein